VPPTCPHARPCCSRDRRGRGRGPAAAPLVVVVVPPPAAPGGGAGFPPRAVGCSCRIPLFFSFFCSLLFIC